MSEAYDFDLLSIGSGPAGQRAAVQAAKLGKRAAVVENCTKNGALDIPSLRDRLKTSRKYLIPLLEHLDATGVTLRQGAHRVLRKR